MNDSKKQILLTALKLFLTKSYKEVSLRDIVNEVGLTKGAFYHYYTSKDELFEATVKYFYNHGLVSNYSDFPKTSLKEFYEYYLTILSEPGDFDDIEKEMNYSVFFSEAAKRIPDFLGIHNAQRKKEIWAWAEIIEMAKRNKEIKASVSNEDLASMFMNLSDGIASSKVLCIKDNEGALNDIKREWDNLYSLLKAHK